MSFTDKQRRSLTAKLKYRHVKTRASQGNTLSYLEGWHVIAEANRIFGYDSWDRQTLYPRCVWSDRQAARPPPSTAPRFASQFAPAARPSRAKALGPASDEPPP